MKTYLLIPAIAAVSFVGVFPTIAAQQNARKATAYAGEVTTISPLAHTITVLHGGQTETFRVDRNTKMGIPEKSNATLKDFKFGNKVSVQYQDTADGVTALTIREQPAK